MRVLVIGSGGREHALLLGLRRDPSVTDLHVAPGNAGTAAVATNKAIASAFNTAQGMNWITAPSPSRTTEMESHSA